MLQKANANNKQSHHQERLKKIPMERALLLSTEKAQKS
jgi:hypothetical protein